MDPNVRERANRSTVAVATASQAPASVTVTERKPGPLADPFTIVRQAQREQDQLEQALQQGWRPELPCKASCEWPDPADVYACHGCGKVACWCEGSTSDNELCAECGSRPEVPPPSDAEYREALQAELASIREQERELQRALHPLKERAQLLTWRLLSVEQALGIETAGAVCQCGHGSIVHRIRSSVDDQHACDGDGRGPCDCARYRPRR